VFFFENVSSSYRFAHNGLPYDLGDDHSEELARMIIGSNNIQRHYSSEIIDRSLPDNWRWDDPEGTGHYVYIDTKIKADSTVHPARFYNANDEIAWTLPPGWDRRLDSWGNLFFVDHHTRNAVREDPRFNNKIDQETGLPKGWKEIKDHKEQQYFYNEAGRMILGTYDATGMNTKSMVMKKPLTRIPQNGDDPNTLVEAPTPLIRRAVEKAAQAAAERAAATSVPPMTPEEREFYYCLFEAAQKKKPRHISLPEAIIHCSNLYSYNHLPAQTIVSSLNSTDKNHDQLWNVDEYADALHLMVFELKKNLKTRPFRPWTQVDFEISDAMFEKFKQPGSQVLTVKDVLKACKDFNLPGDLLKSLFTASDENRDRRWNIDEFARAMQLVMHEVEAREGNCHTSQNPTP